MFRRKIREYNSKTPAWFKDWDKDRFSPVETKAARNERMIYLILAAVIGLNTAGNYYHVEIAQFFIRLFTG